MRTAAIAAQRLGVSARLTVHPKEAHIFPTAAFRDLHSAFYVSVAWRRDCSGRDVYTRYFWWISGNLWGRVFIYLQGSKGWPYYRNTYRQTDDRQTRCQTYKVSDRLDVNYRQHNFCQVSLGDRLSSRGTTKHL